MINIYKVNLSQIKWQVGQFRNYYTSVNDMFRKNLNNLNKDYEVFTQSQESLSNEYGLSAGDYFVDAYHEQQLYTQLFYESLIIQQFSFIEVELKRVVDWIEMKKGEKFKKYISKEKSVFKRYIDFICSKSGIKKEFYNYDFISDLSVLRNTIVHNNSTVRFYDKEFNSIKKLSESGSHFSMIAKGWGAKANQIYEIKLGEEKFIELCISNAYAFLEDVLKKLEKTPLAGLA